MICWGLYVVIEKQGMTLRSEHQLMDAQTLHDLLPSTHGRPAECHSVDVELQTDEDIMQPLTASCLY